MRRAKTHFEQIPVALVKKIAEEAFPEVKEIRNDNVILKVPAKKTEPHASRAHSRCRNGRTMEIRLGSEDDGLLNIRTGKSLCKRPWLRLTRTN